MRNNIHIDNCLDIDHKSLEEIELCSPFYGSFYKENCQLVRGVFYRLNSNEMVCVHNHITGDYFVERVEGDDWLIADFKYVKMTVRFEEIQA